MGEVIVCVNQKLYCQFDDLINEYLKIMENKTTSTLDDCLEYEKNRTKFLVAVGILEAQNES